MIRKLRLGLAESDAAERKRWAHELIDQRIPLESLFSLWHADVKTAQRFMWFVGDLSDLEPGVVAPCIVFLFSLRDEMPFPGMHRSVAKWLLRTNLPPEIEQDGMKQLFAWLADPHEEIGCKHYSARALANLVQQGRASSPRLKKVLRAEVKHRNPAYAARTQKLLNEL